MKWGVSILAMVMAMVVGSPVLADSGPSAGSGQGFDYYDPVTGMHYQQPKPTLVDGQLFQFCVDPGGATWACTSARVQGDSWISDPGAMKGLTDEQRTMTWTVWSAKDELGFVRSQPTTQVSSTTSIIIQAPPATANIAACMDLADGLAAICVDWANIENSRP